MGTTAENFHTIAVTKMGSRHSRGLSLVALGLSNIRYSEAVSSRNITIVGISLFFLSIPAYFQQYGIYRNSNLSVPSYYQPYDVASHGPFKSQYKGVNYVMNTLIDEHGDCVHSGCDFGQYSSRK